MNTALMLLSVLCPILFVALCYFVGKDKELTKAVKTLSDEVAYNKWELQKAKWNNHKIITLKQSKVVSNELVHKLGSDKALDEVRKAIIKEMGKGIEDFITFHIIDEQKYCATKVTGVIRVLRGEE